MLPEATSLSFENYLSESETKAEMLAFTEMVVECRSTAVECILGFARELRRVVLIPDAYLNLSHEKVHAVMLMSQEVRAVLPGWFVEFIWKTLRGKFLLVWKEYVGPSTKVDFLLVVHKLLYPLQLLASEPVCEQRGVVLANLSTASVEIAGAKRTGEASTGERQPDVLTADLPVDGQDARAQHDEVVESTAQTAFPIAEVVGKSNGSECGLQEDHPIQHAPGELQEPFELFEYTFSCQCADADGPLRVVHSKYIHRDSEHMGEIVPLCRFCACCTEFQSCCKFEGGVAITCTSCSAMVLSDEELCSYCGQPLPCGGDAGSAETDVEHKKGHMIGSEGDKSEGTGENDGQMSEWSPGSTGDEANKIEAKGKCDLAIGTSFSESCASNSSGGNASVVLLDAVVPVAVCYAQESLLFWCLQLSNQQVELRHHQQVVMMQGLGLTDEIWVGMQLVVESLAENFMPLFQNNGKDYCDESCRIPFYFEDNNHLARLDAWLVSLFMIPLVEFHHYAANIIIAIDDLRKARSFIGA